MHLESNPIAIESDPQTLLPGQNNLPTPLLASSGIKGHKDLGRAPFFCPVLKTANFPAALQPALIHRHPLHSLDLHEQAHQVSRNPALGDQSQLGALHKIGIVGDRLADGQAIPGHGAGHIPE